mmetsp:Transcript_23635/g.75665  ORF Transcript_23635/g.75665 Transcript_23635/m.75665 type:complete len:452 (-) Transcript_23635:338-1693(-)
MISGRKISLCQIQRGETRSRESRTREKHPDRERQRVSAGERGLQATADTARHAAPAAARREVTIAPPPLAPCLARKHPPLPSLSPPLSSPRHPPSSYPATAAYRDSARSFVTSSFSFVERDFGICTLTLMKCEPRTLRLLSLGAPLPSSRSVAPGCVPAGSATSTGEPSTVSILRVEPRMASRYETLTSEKMSIPSRRKPLLGETERKTYRSPEGPPFGPASPSPRTRSRLPFSTPGGIVTVSCLERLFVPRPSHEPQYFSTTEPEPPQVGQRDCCCILPRMVLTVCITTPRPPQVVQVVTDAPGATPEPAHVAHASSCVMRIFFSPPKRAVLKSSSRSKRRSSPCVGRFWRARPPPPPGEPPKKDSKMSPRSKSCMFGAPAAPLMPAIPNWSYRCRISGLESTWYASLMVWNFSLASSDGLTSGWYLRAAERYARLMSPSFAFRATPSAW